jgi:hypothetical protein
MKLPPGSISGSEIASAGLHGQLRLRCSWRRPPPRASRGGHVPLHAGRQLALRLTHRQHVRRQRCALNGLPKPRPFCGGPDSDEHQRGRHVLPRQLRRAGIDPLRRGASPGGAGLQLLRSKRRGWLNSLHPGFERRLCELACCMRL